jgi:ABC-type nitrate/sulfonate/bicarbonate transport system permease component
MPRVLLKTARIHRLSLMEEIWRVRLPAAAPHLSCRASSSPSPIPSSV